MRELAEQIGTHTSTILNWEIKGKMPWSKNYIRALKKTVPGVGKFFPGLAG